MDKIRQFLYKIVHPLVRVYWRVFRPVTFGARAIILNEDCVLLVKNLHGNYWLLPGGKVDGNETAEECLRRELLEEVAISTSKYEYRLGQYISDREGKRDTISVFVARVLSKKFEKQWELADARWFLLSQLPKDISPATLRRIVEYQSGQKDITVNW